MRFLLTLLSLLAACLLAVRATGSCGHHGQPCCPDPEPRCVPSCYEEHGHCYDKCESKNNEGYDCHCQHDCRGPCVSANTPFGGGGQPELCSVNTDVCCCAKPCDPCGGHGEACCEKEPKCKEGCHDEGGYCNCCPPGCGGHGQPACGKPHPPCAPKCSKKGNKCYWD